VTLSFRRVLAAAALLLACWPLAAQNKAASTGPTTVLLPELKGTVNSQASDVNDGNCIVGTMWDAADVGTGVIWTPEGAGWKLTVIGSGPHPAGPLPRAINNSREIILNRFDGVDHRASVYTPSGTEIRLPIPKLAPARTSSYASAIDESGTILGSIYNPPDPVTGRTRDYQQLVWVRRAEGWEAVLLDASCHDADPTVTCQYSSISRTSGWIVGSMTRPVGNGSWGWAARGRIDADGFLSNFTLLDLERLAPPDSPEAPVSGAYLIGESGVSAGYYRTCEPGTAGCTNEPAFWDGRSARTTLPTYVAFTNQLNARAVGINGAGEVVGWATFTRGGTQDKAAAWWKRNATAAIQLPVSKPYQTAEATAINNTGLAVGTARQSAGRPHAVAWKLK
jgi:hypothetical protein